MNAVKFESGMNLNKYDLIVVGASLSAATVAYIAAKEYRYKVLVIESNDGIKGVYGHPLERENANYFVSTGDIRVRNFFNSIVDCVDCKVSQKLMYNGKCYDFTFDRGAIDYAVSRKEILSNVAEGDLVEAVLSSLLKENSENYEAMEKMLTLIGLASSFLGKAPINFYPAGGFKKLIERMLSNENIEVAFSVDVYSHISVNDDDTVSLFGEVLSVPIVYSGRLDSLFGNKGDQFPFFSFNPVDCQREVENEQIGKTVLSHYCLVGENLPKEMQKESSNSWELLLDDSGIPFYPRQGLNSEQKERIDSYRDRACKLDNFYLCGPLATHRPMNIAEMVTDAMAVFSKVVFPHEINLIPDYVSYRRPLEKLLDPGDCFQKNSDVGSDLLIGDLSRPIPKISIIIPTYKRLDSLKRTLLCAVQQDLDNSEYEIVIVDNDPELYNETYRYLSKCRIENLFYYKNRKNLGAYGNMNRCMELCRTEWISMVHDDDAVFKNSLRWALNSIEFVNDKNLGMVIPRQLQMFSTDDINRRIAEPGSYHKMNWMKLRFYHGSFMFKVLLQMRDKVKRRYWKISKRDCYVIPFLYPAPSYGTLINRKAMLDIGGYGEGYPNDDGLCSIRMSEKYSVYLCGEAWGLYSMSTADYNKPKSAVQFVECTEQYRRYMNDRDSLCGKIGEKYCAPTYLKSVYDDCGALTWRLGFCLNEKNYPHFDEYNQEKNNSYKKMRMCKKFEHLWELLLLMKVYWFGKKITKEQIDFCNGEHY